MPWPDRGLKRTNRRAACSARSISLRAAASARRRSPIGQDRLKEYVHLHRLITGLSARTVWEALGAGHTVEEIAAPLPDEFHEWVKAVAARLHTAVSVWENRVETSFAGILAQLAEGWTRKDFAMVAAKHELLGYLFARLDGKPYQGAIWQELKPSADETPGGVYSGADE